MDVKKFQLAMRPKKYLTHDFLVYQDPKIQAARSEMQAGGIVQREMHATNPFVGRQKKTTAFKLGKKKGLALKKTLPKGISLTWRERDKAWILQSKLLNLNTSNPTEQEVLDKINEFQTRKKKLFPKQITPGTFVELRSSDKNIKLTGKEFTDFLNKEGYTTITGRKFTPEIVASYQRNLNLTNKNIGSYRTIKEIKEIIKDSPGGNIVLKNFKNNEDYLRQYATNIIKNKNRRALEGGFPRGNNKKEIMWNNFFTASQRGDRITMSGTFNGKDLSDPANWPRKNGQIDWTVKDKDGVQAWKNVSFTDNQAPKKPKTFYWNADIQGDLKTQIDDTFGKGFFEKNLSAYDQQAIDRNKTITIDGKPKNINRFIAEEMIKKDFQAIPGNEGKVPSKDYVELKMKRYNFQEAHHPEGIANNPYKVELASRDANKKLGILESQRARGVITNAEFKKQAQAISDQYGGIRYKVGSKYVGKKGNTKTILTSILTDLEKNPDEIVSLVSSFSNLPECQVIQKASGGRVGFNKGSNICYQDGLKNLMKAKTDPKLAKGLMGKAMRVGGKALRFLELPLEIAIEGLLVGDAMLKGQTFRQAVLGNTLVMRTLMPGGWSTSLDEETVKLITENNPAAKTFFESKTRADKYEELQQKLANAKQRAETDNTFVNENYLEVKQAQEALDKFEQDNFQYFDRDKEILNPQGYYAQQADEASNKFLYDQSRESALRKGIDAMESGGEDMYVTGLDVEPLTEVERAERNLEQGTQAVEALGMAPTQSEFEQSISKDQKASMKENIKKQFSNYTDDQVNAMVDMIMGIQYDIITTPYKGFDSNKIQPLAIDTFATGGRVGFSGGGLTRRAFLKFAAGVAALLGAAKTGIIKLTTPTAKRVLKDAPTGTPDWFAPLVDKIMKEGVDAGETMKTVTGRETVKKLEVPAPGSDGALTDKYYLYENPDTGEIRVDIDIPGAGANDQEFSIYMRPDRVEGINDDGTPMLNEGEFFLAEERATGVQSGPDDWDMELLSTDVNLDDSASDWYRVEKFATGKTDEVARQKKLKYKQDIEADPVQDIVDRQGEYDYSYARDTDIDE